MVNSQSYRGTPPELEDKRQSENCFDTKQAFIADSFHLKGLTLKFSIKIPFILPYNKGAYPLYLGSPTELPKQKTVLTQNKSFHF